LDGLRRKTDCLVSCRPPCCYTNRVLKHFRDRPWRNARNGSSVEPSPLSRKGCTRGKGRRKRLVPSGTRAITSLTAPLSFVSLASSLSPPQTVTSPRRFLYRRPIYRTTARRRSRTGGGDDSEKHHDIGRNLRRSLHRHLEFRNELDLVLDRNNGGKVLFLLPSSSLCENRPCLSICGDMQIRYARVSIRIGFG
jgi:hypothetical protein